MSNEKAELRVEHIQLYPPPICDCGKVMTLAAYMNFFWFCAGEHVGDIGCGARKPLL